MAKVKITAVKKVNNKDMFGDNPPARCTAAAECDTLELGQEFISENTACPLVSALGRLLIYIEISFISFLVVITLG